MPDMGRFGAASALIAPQVVGTIAPTGRDHRHGFALPAVIAEIRFSAHRRVSEGSQKTMEHMRRRADGIGAQDGKKGGERHRSAAKKESRRPAMSSSAIHLAPVAQAQNPDRDALVVDLTDQPPIADSMLPEFA